MMRKPQGTVGQTAAVAPRVAVAILDRTPMAGEAIPC